MWTVPIDPTRAQKKIEGGSYKDLRAWAADAEILGSERMNKQSLIAALKKTLIHHSAKNKSRHRAAAFKKQAAKSFDGGFSPVHFPVEAGNALPRSQAAIGFTPHTRKIRVNDKAPHPTKTIRPGTSQPVLPASTGIVPWQASSMAAMLANQRRPATAPVVDGFRHLLSESKPVADPTHVDSLTHARRMKALQKYNHDLARRDMERNSRMVMQMVVGDHYYRATETTMTSAAKRMNMTIDPTQTLGLTPKGHPAYSTPRHQHEPHQSTHGENISTRNERELLKSFRRTRDIAKLLEQDKFRRTLRRIEHNRTKKESLNTQYKAIMAKSNSGSLAHYGRI